MEKGGCWKTVIIKSEIEKLGGSDWRMGWLKLILRKGYGCWK